MKLISLPEKLCNGHYLLRFASSAHTEPGQFVELKLNAYTDPLLRRPFSIYDADGETVSVIIRVAGRVTAALAALKDPDAIDVMGPYGKGFSLIDSGHALLVGGGVGNAPLHYLAKRLRARGVTVSFIYAARSADLIYCHDNFTCGTDSLCYVTDDGSCGEKGYAVEALTRTLAKSSFDRAYVCGPTVMMKSCAQELGAAGIPFQVSLENYFGCGIGICSGCSVDTVRGKKRACVEGPVFDGSDLVWEKL